MQSALIVALVLNRVARARLAEGLRGTAMLQFCETLEELRRLVRRLDVRGVVVEPTDRLGMSTVACVRAIKRDVPAVPVVSYLTLAGDSTSDIVTFANAGADTMLILNALDSPALVRAAFASSRAASSGREALARLLDDIPDAVREIAEYCLTNATRTLSVLEIASVHGIHRKTLTNLFTRAELPAPSTFVSWCRLVAVADPVTVSELSLDRIASDYDFPSAASMRGMFRRYLGIRPRQLRSLGGPEFVVRCFAQSLGRRRPHLRVIGGGQSPDSLRAG